LITSFRDFIPSCIHGVKRDESFDCQECKKRKQERDDSEKHYDWLKKEREEEEAKIAELKKKHEEQPQEYMSFIPKKFREKSFDTFQGSIEIKNVLQKYSDGFICDIRYIDSRPIMSEGLLQYPGSVLLIGKTGCGKTHMAVSIARELVKRSLPIRCLFITAPELLLEIRSKFNNNSSSADAWDHDYCKTEEDVIDKYSNCGLLILDDLGAEKSTDFAIQSLYLIIDRRNRELRPTIVTTNLSLEEIEEKIDARMASRLADMKVIKINMPDYRKKRG
jgi:DNA replication protein DnaC